MMEGMMKQAEDAVWREVDNEIVVINSDGRKVHVFNKTAAYIWKMCTGEYRSDEIVTRLCERYDVTMEKATADVNDMMIKMMEKGLLKRVDEL